MAVTVHNHNAAVRSISSSASLKSSTLDLHPRKTPSKRASQMFWSQVFGTFHNGKLKASPAKPVSKPPQDPKHGHAHGHHRSQSQPAAFAVYVTQPGHQPISIPLQATYDHSKSSADRSSAPVTVTIARNGVHTHGGHGASPGHRDKENRHSYSHSNSRPKEFVVPQSDAYLNPHIDTDHHRHSTRPRSRSRSPVHERSHDSHADHRARSSPRHAHQTPVSVAPSNAAVYGGSRTAGSVRHSISTPKLAQSAGVYYDPSHHPRSTGPQPIALPATSNYVSTPTRYPQIIQNVYTGAALTGHHGSAAPVGNNYAQPRIPATQSQYATHDNHAKSTQSPYAQAAAAPTMTPVNRSRKISTSTPKSVHTKGIHTHDQHHVTFSSVPPEERSIRHFSSVQHLNDLTSTPVNWPTHIHGRPRPKGYFNRRGDQFIRRGVVRRQAIPSMEWSDLFVGYPEPGMGWRDENGHWIPEGGGILRNK
ncbi:hypothetical protein FRC19_011780 [Serendipita sp. 401]|nr:hypothetical protein FRC19_011780 [Serendipita sp. 401]